MHLLVWEGELLDDVREAARPTLMNTTIDRASGTSHHVLTKPGHRPITVPVKKGRTLKEGTARAILRQAGVTEDEFFDVY